MPTELKFGGWASIPRLKIDAIQYACSPSFRIQLQSLFHLELFNFFLPLLSVESVFLFCSLFLFLIVGVPTGSYPEVSPERYSDTLDELSEDDDPTIGCKSSSSDRGGSTSTAKYFRGI